MKNPHIILLMSYLQKKHGITRRDFFEILKAQAMKLNGQVVESSKQTIQVGDRLEVDLGEGNFFDEVVKPFKFHRPILVLFNKPLGYVVSKEDKHNKTIYELLPPKRRQDFFYVGRLDKDSHGLLLLTNDPKLVDLYENPKSDIHKTYEVIIDQPIKSHHIEKMKKGILVDQQGHWIKGDTPVAEQLKKIMEITKKKSGYTRVHEEDEEEQKVELLKALSVSCQTVKGKTVARIVLNEGKKRHIRRMLIGLGYVVKDLKRIKFGKYQLGTIKPGKYMMQEILEL